MKTLKEALSMNEALFSRRNLKPKNPYGLTEKDLIGDIKDFPMGVVVRMWEETKKQNKKYTIEIFLREAEDKCRGLFLWGKTGAGTMFWHNVIDKKDFNLFFKKYPEYERYN